MVASGGEDDLAMLWQLQDGRLLARGTHTDSVTRLAFNHDGHLFASADLNGLIQVWDIPWPSGANDGGDSVTEQKITPRCSLEVGEEPWLKWHSAANVLLVGGSDGTVWLWQTAK